MSITRQLYGDATFSVEIDNFARTQGRVFQPVSLTDLEFVLGWFRLVLDFRFTLCGGFIRVGLDWNLRLLERTAAQIKVQPRFQTRLTVLPSVESYRVDNGQSEFNAQHGCFQELTGEQFAFSIRIFQNSAYMEA